MKSITLYFPNFKVLWEFKQTANVLNCRIHSGEMTITAELNEQQIELATSDYEARVPDEKVA